MNKETKNTLIGVGVVAAGVTMNNTYRLEHSISYSEVDSNYKLRLDYIFSHFQNIADLHSKEMGTDGETLLEKSNVFWVLRKVKLKLSQMPRFNEKITVETWPLKAKGVRYERDFMISKDNTPLVMGSSEWCTLDYDTHRPRKVDSVAYPQDRQDMEYREDRSGSGDFIRAKFIVDEKDFNHSYRSSFVDIDTNKHTNNVAYLRMMLNCFSPEEFEALDIDEMQVNFQSQTFYGDEIKMYKKQIDNGLYIEGQVDNKPVFNCIIKQKGNS